MADQVMIHNKLNQTVKLVLRNAVGEAETVRLAKRGRLGPIDVGQVAKRTRLLADRGHVKIRPV